MKVELGNNLFLKYHSGDKNYGDQLNNLVWPKYLENVSVKLKKETLLYGVGTILNSSNAERGNKVIFGSGVGYGDTPEITKEWTPYCVRGPKTAEKLGISEGFAVTDPGILVVDFVEKCAKREGVAFFPHESSLRRIPWKRYCEWLDLNFISPRWEVERVNELIRKSKLVVTEAMHGAITADALRVPWIPIKMNDSILDFKWKDWCKSIGLEYDPVVLGGTDISHRTGKALWRIKAPIMLAKVKLTLNHAHKNLSRERVHKEKYKEIKRRMGIMLSDFEEGRLMRHDF